MRDVRMRGFAERADVEEVERFLAEHTATLPAEPVDLRACSGRILAEAVRAAVDVPGFDRSAMDGYAVRGADTFGASPYDPIRLALIGESLPGRPAGAALAPGQAVRIMTGAPIPDGADAVVMAEVCEEDGDAVVWVSDRGDGFDPDAVDPDRLGVRESIVGRMERAGGTASLRSSSDGTEWELRLPTRVTDDEAAS